MSNKLFVGGLSWGTDDQLLHDTFAEHGSVQEARVITDRETGRSRGFGFVTMSTKEEADGAISALDGKQIDGRTIRVNEAQERSRDGNRGNNRRW